MMKRSLLGGLMACAILLSACAPEVGSNAWCEDMDAKAKGDWSANEATAYAKHCIFKSADE
ncbi:DUF3012 domain-containing protein [Algiphilus sp. NNCM1]|nr:DUF3012 domain-containing protein [Algiphilus sp.]MBY8964597.1 DUF3012 domain-containing protein [Algiphilus acroporae]MCI5103255.1 DUF3012 domain-containing protein [Algiphilus sp.]